MYDEAVVATSGGATLAATGGAVAEFAGVSVPLWTYGLGFVVLGGLVYAAAKLVPSRS